MFLACNQERLVNGLEAYLLEEDVALRPHRIRLGMVLPSSVDVRIANHVNGKK